ncbi:MAG: dTDP-glucose 4,6-dehydratase [Muribaculaceae bacterium]|nr:dTDP-glucose 4,6-dehydratase [Muribaculaceae bacterium]
MTNNTFLVTGGAGFIGTNFVKFLLNEDAEAKVIVLDALTYCGNIKSLSAEIESHKIEFVKGDIIDRQLVATLLERYTPAYIVNFAAETHVDRSLDDSRPFVRTNVEGTLNLLDCATAQRRAQLENGKESTLRKFVQISTDEVYGQLEIDCPEGAPLSADTLSKLCREDAGVTYGSSAFTETMPLCASSPYSASKASADLLALAYCRSFGLPVAITRCSNNYGPYQYPEKLIPLMINNILLRKPLPVYGRGLNVRDWIYAEDHARGVYAVATAGRVGQVYNLGGYSERRNIDVVKKLINIVASQVDDNAGIDESLISYVGDRPGHDMRYAIDASKAIDELGWRPLTSFDDGLKATVAWYLANRQWLNDIVSGDYLSYYDKMYSNR